MAKSTSSGFSAAERAAMKERATELKTSARRESAAEKAAADEQDCLAKIAEMPDEDRVIGEAVHAIVKANAPELAAKTWYGMPAYAKDGKLILHFKPAAKFKVRYAEVGFGEHAALDDGALWPTAYAVTALNSDVVARLSELVRTAAGAA
ncbi:MAG: iron chaperone [Candidatus Nanopelagicales bacterium]